MSKRDHFIIVGRTSEEIARGIVNRFGEGKSGEFGPLIDRANHVIQSRIGSYDDGEANAELFVDGKLPDHPIEQTLSDEEKKDIAKRLKKSSVTIVLSSSGLNTSNRALSMLFMAASLKQDHGVGHIKLIGPALPFMRNDRRFRSNGPEGETLQYNAVTGKLYPQFLKYAGVDEVVGFEPHSRDGVRHYRKAFGKKNASFVNMGAFFAESILNEMAPVNDGECQIMVGSPDGMNKPDDYGIARASSFGAALYKNTAFSHFADAQDFRERPYMFGIHKERSGPKKTSIVGFHGDVQGKLCIIIDDIISSGGTTLQAAAELKRRGASKVIAIATHGVLTDGALKKMLDSKDLDGIMLTDTIPGVLDKLNGNGLIGHEKLQVTTVSPLVNIEIARSLPKNKRDEFMPQLG